MNIVIFLYNGFTALDAIGPYEVLSKLPNAQVKFVAEQKGNIVADTGFLQVSCNYSIDEIHEADVLLIPGATITFIKETNNKKVIEWIQKIHKTTTYTTSVCSGSIILAAATLLQQKKATSHWAVMNLLKDYDAEPVQERIVVADKIITSAGVSAGLDMALLLADKIAGIDEAKKYQLMIEYDPQPHIQCGSVHLASPETIKASKKQLMMDAQKGLNFMELIKYAPLLLKLK